MKFWWYDIHISDKELDKQWHEDYEFANEWKKDAKFLAATWMWPGIGVNEIYEKWGKLYLIPDGVWVYEIVNDDLHNLIKVNGSSKKA